MDSKIFMLKQYSHKAFLEDKSNVKEKISKILNFMQNFSCAPVSILLVALKPSYLNLVQLQILAT